MLFQKFLRNAFWNWCGLGANIASGVLLTPYILHTLGETHFGLWTLISSLVGCYGILDIGLRSAIGRQLVYFATKANPRKISQTFVSGWILLMVLAGAAVVVSFLLPPVLFSWFPSQSDDIASGQWGLRLLGFSFAVTLFFHVFDALLWANHRFDLLNLIDACGVVLRTLLILCLLQPHDGIRTLCIINFIVVLSTCLVKMTCSLRYGLPLRVRWASVSLRAVAPLLSFGCWTYVITLMGMISAQLYILVAGFFVPFQVLSCFGVANRLLNYVNLFFTQGADAFTPCAVSLSSSGNKSQIHETFRLTAIFYLGLAIFVVSLTAVLSEGIIRTWIRLEMKDAALIFVLLILGECFPMAQRITRSYLLGMGKPRFLALLAVGEFLFLLPCAIAAVAFFGIVGLCVCCSLSSLVFRGIIPLWYVCRRIDLPVVRYARQVVMPVCGFYALPVTGLVAARLWHPPMNFLDLLLMALVYTLVIVSGLVFVFRASLSVRLRSRSRVGLWQSLRQLRQ